MRTQQAGVTDPRRQLALAEVHDCFTPTELVLMEDLGFAERGTAWKEVLAGTFALDGELPVNPDGGLKSFGHPVGASGLCGCSSSAGSSCDGEATPERQIAHRPDAGPHPQPRWATRARWCPSSRWWAPNSAEPQRRALPAELLAALFALAAAFANALNVVAQHRANVQAPTGASVWRLARYLVRQPVWLLGGVGMIGAFVFQALALHNGQLSVVQPLLVTELVFALILRRLWVRQEISAAAWTSAAVTCIGLAIFVAMSEPQGGKPVPSASAWVSVIAVLGGLACGVALFARHGTPVRRAALFATSASIVWALEASFIKTTTDTLTAHGVLGMFGRWPVYTLIIGGTAGILLEQSALHVGPLSVSQPLLVAVDPLVSVVLGVWLFDETFTDDPGKIALGVAAFIVMAVGILLLSRTAPQDIGGVAPSAAYSG